MIERTDFVSVPVTDLERSTKWYAETLGAEFFTRKYSDYRLETPRSHNVWASPPPDDARRD